MGKVKRTVQFRTRLRRDQPLSKANSSFRISCTHRPPHRHDEAPVSPNHHHQEAHPHPHPPHAHPSARTKRPRSANVQPQDTRRPPHTPTSPTSRTPSSPTS